MAEHNIYCPDFKDDSGLWLKSKTVQGIRYRSRAGVLWAHLNNRILNKTTLKLYPTYQGCENKFQSFQEFTDWCQIQKGYMNKEGLRFWNLDKDIIVPHNKVYSPETCCFVPPTINKLLITPNIKRGDLPIGVSYHKLSGKFQAEVSSGQKARYLGLFTCPLEAHRAWQLAKVEEIENAIERINGIVDDKVLVGLQLHSRLILDDYKNLIETVRP